MPDQFLIVVRVWAFVARFSSRAGKRQLSGSVVPSMKVDVFLRICTISVSDFVLDFLSSPNLVMFRFYWFQSNILYSCLATDSRFPICSFSLDLSFRVFRIFSECCVGPVAILIRRVHPMNFYFSSFVHVFFRGNGGGGVEGGIGPGKCREENGERDVGNKKMIFRRSRL